MIKHHSVFIAHALRLQLAERRLEDTGLSLKLKEQLIRELVARFVIDSHVNVLPQIHCIKSERQAARASENFKSQLAAIAADVCPRFIFTSGNSHVFLFNIKVAAKKCELDSVKQRIQQSKAVGDVTEAAKLKSKYERVAQEAKDQLAKLTKKQQVYSQ